MRDFAYHRATSLADAKQALSAGGALALAGGTTLVDLAKLNVLVPEVVVDLSALPGMADIALRDGRLHIGALARMTDVARHPDIRSLAPAIASALELAASGQIRNMATIGGNLFAETPYGDFTVALLALDAQVVVQAGYGTGRGVPLEEFLAGRERGTLPGLITGVQVSRPANPADFRFRKVSRVKPKGIAVMSIAAHLPAQGGRIMQARVAYGAMAPVPVRARGVERALEGKTLDAAAIQAAQQAALEGCRPATDAIASEWYRREVLPVHLGRLLAGEAR